MDFIGEDDDRTSLDDVPNYEETSEDSERTRASGRRAMLLAGIGLLVGVTALLVVIGLLTPPARKIPDVRPSIEDAAESRRQDLLDVHEQRMLDLTTLEAEALPEPQLVVVCALLRGDAPRQQRCELRAVSYLAPQQIRRAEEVPQEPCLAAEISYDALSPILTTVPAQGCKPAPELAWWDDQVGEPIDGHAAWVVRRGAKTPDGVRLALTTRTDLDTYDIGDCPMSGCGVGQIQLPKTDFSAPAQPPSTTTPGQ